MKKLMFTVLAASALVACNNEETLKMQSPYAIDFADANVEGVTRAAADPSFNNNSNKVEAMNVWAFMNEPDGTVLEGEKVTKENGDWTYTNVQYWIPGDNTYYFAALAPMNDGSNNVGWSLDATGANYDGAGVVSFTNVDGSEDLLYAATSITAPTSTTQEVDPVKFEFSHLLSKVKFTFKNGFTTDNADIIIEDIQMTAPEIATIDLAVENWWDGDDWKIKEGYENTLSLKFGDVARLDKGQDDESTYERLTIPAGKDQVYTITFKVKVLMGEQEAATFEKTSTVTGVALEMGKAYNFVTEINPSNLNLREIEFDVVVKEWVIGGEVAHPVVATYNNAPYTSLQAAIDAAVDGGTIYLASDVKETVWIQEKNGVDLVIEGNGVKYDGEIRIHNGSTVDNNGSVTIKNVNFETYTADVNFVYAVEFVNTKRYSQNITVENCTFNALAGTAAEKSVVGVKVNSTKNLVIKDCKATNMHSLLQAQSCQADITVDGIEVVDCKSGVSFGNTAFPTIKNAIIEAASYGVRADGNASRGALVVENVTIDAYRPIIVRKNKTAYSVEVKGNNDLTAGDYYQVIFTTGDDEATYVAPAAGNFSFTGADDINVYPTDAAASGRIQDAAGLTAALADASKSEIVLESGVVLEGTFNVTRSVTIKSNANNKATIKGRVNVSSCDNNHFENIKFDINNASKHKNTFSGAPYQYPGIVVAYGAAMSFEGCEFKTSLSDGVCGINAGNHADASDLLTVNNCKFVGDFYAIRTRTLFSITNNEFDIYTNQGTLAAVWTWGNANSGATQVTFTGNTNANANKVYSVQMTASNFVYNYVNINVQGNENFHALADGVNPARFNGTHTFAQGSETF